MIVEKRIAGELHVLGTGRERGPVGNLNPKPVARLTLIHSVGREEKEGKKKEKGRVPSLASCRA